MATNATKVTRKKAEPKPVKIRDFPADLWTRCKMAALKDGITVREYVISALAASTDRRV